MRTIIVTLALGLILTATAEARMYQWSDPATGTVQLSGTPPAWYRAAAPAPRTFVFDDGQLVDDTAIPVSELQRRALREQAFGAADSTELAPEQSPEEPGPTSGALHDTLSRALDAGIDIEAAAAEVRAEQARAAAARAVEDVDVAERVTQLKALVEAWDQQRLEAARALIESLPEAAPDAAWEHAAAADAAP